MLDLDKKVFGRDSIYFALEPQLNGLFSKLKKKFRKITRKIGKAVLPKKIYKSLSRFETKNRKLLKKLGAVALVATGAYFFKGPKIFSAVKGLGGSSIASAASSPLAKTLITTAIKKKLSDNQQKKIAKKIKKLNAEQVLNDPEIVKLSMEIAAAQAAQKERGKTNKIAAALMAKEGVAEMEYQVNKIAGVPTDTILKIGIPIGFGLLALLI